MIISIFIGIFDAEIKSLSLIVINALTVAPGRIILLCKYTFAKYLTESVSDDPFCTTLTYLNLKKFLSVAVETIIDPSLDKFVVLLSRIAIPSLFDIALPNTELL